MPITMPVFLTERTHSALMAYCENLDGEKESANVLAGELLSEALRLYGYMDRAERVKAGAPE